MRDYSHVVQVGGDPSRRTELSDGASHLSNHGLLRRNNAWLQQHRRQDRAEATTLRQTTLRRETPPLPLDLGNTD